MGHGPTGGEYPPSVFPIPVADRLAGDQSVHIIQRLPVRVGATAVAWSPDGTLLATMGGLPLRVVVWDTRTWQSLWEASGDFGPGEALAFSDDSRVLVTSAAQKAPEFDQAALTLWDAREGRIVGHIDGPFPNEGSNANFARKIALDRQDGLMAMLSQRTRGRPVAIYDTHTWKPIGRITIEDNTVETITFGPNGMLAIGTVRGTIALYDARTQSLRRTIDAHLIIQSLAYSPDGKYIASGQAGVPEPIKIWKVDDGSVVEAYPGVFSSLHGLSWSPDGRYLASASFDRAIRLWPVGTSDGKAQLIGSFNESAWAVAFSPDGTLLAGAGSEGAIVARVK